MTVTLPVVGGSNNSWGTTLNTALTQLDQTDTNEASTRLNADNTESTTRAAADTALNVRADSALYRSFLYNGVL